MNYLSIDEEILINQWAQGVVDDQAIQKIYLARKPEEVPSLLRNVCELVQQASASNQDMEATISAAPIKATRSVCVILRKGVNNEVLQKLVSLKGTDAEDSFLLLLYLFRIADNRRRANEKECTHWWHRDLSNPLVVEAVKRERKAGRL